MGSELRRDRHRCSYPGASPEMRRPGLGSTTDQVLGHMEVGPCMLATHVEVGSCKVSPMTLAGAGPWNVWTAAKANVKTALRTSRLRSYASDSWNMGYHLQRRKLEQVHGRWTAAKARVGRSASTGYTRSSPPTTQPGAGPWKVDCVEGERQKERFKYIRSHVRVLAHGMWATTVTTLAGARSLEGGLRRMRTSEGALRPGTPRSLSRSPAWFALPRLGG
jgi:hypothetical protein